ncbi:DNA double-strand break repair nuclease NurA [Aggregatilinea lenta]|uniref:DNA double-strand break repair nuclease NurA n=1 Tax=Aggregatilinea lenta TaxID=913108 RepID=UPI0013C3759A|nr:DNA double-strand break repair nuclease NurA [Aggregatilinea lenta]
MTLEFDKVVSQVAKMGRALAARNSADSQRLEGAWEQFLKLDDLDAVHARIELVRERDAGYRGVAPLQNASEALNRAYPLPEGPARATIIAADGSQIYPSIHAAALYYLTNIGVLVYHDGCDDLPEQYTEPKLFYADSDLRDDRGQMITNDTVNARRTLAELQTLASTAWDKRHIDCDLLAVSDGPLLFWVRNDVPDRRALEESYFKAMEQVQDTDTRMQEDHGHRASLIGYVDRPTSAFLVNLLHLMRLEDEQVRRAALETNGDWEGLLDQLIMSRLLKTGERSAVFVQQSPQNKRYHDRAEDYEIAFFYLNVAPATEKPHLARVEMPMWVARAPQMVEHVHALIHRQCQLMWRYPYALTRADELAVVRSHEKAELEQLIEIELRRNEQVVEHSEKLDSKTVRSGRTRYGQRTRVR